MGIETYILFGLHTVSLTINIIFIFTSSLHLLHAIFSLVCFSVVFPRRTSLSPQPNPPLPHFISAYTFTMRYSVIFPVAVLAGSQLVSTNVFLLTPHDCQLVNRIYLSRASLFPPPLRRVQMSATATARTATGPPQNLLLSRDQQAKIPHRHLQLQAQKLPLVL